MAHRATLILALVILAACAPPGAGRPSGAASPGAEPSPGPTLTPSPTASLAREPTASPTATLGAADCAAFETDPARLGQPTVELVAASQPEAAGQAGLNGSAVLGDQSFPAGDWHQPDPLQAVVVEPAQLLLVRASHEPGVWLCLATMTADAAPFSPRAAAPPPSALVRLGAVQAAGPGVPSFTFAAPAEAGEWVVRVVLTFPSRPGPSRQESFFRLRIGVPAPAVGGAARRPVACGRPENRPPVAGLSVDGGQPIPGTFGSLTWRNTAADVGGEPIGPEVVALPASRLVITTENNLCAGWWRIVLAPRPPASESAPILEPLADLVPPNQARYEVPAGRANRFELAPIPPGDWVVRAELGFVDETGAAIGSTTNYWHLVVR